MKQKRPSGRYFRRASLGPPYPDELQGLGLITREPDPSDRRANSVNLTPHGKTVLDEVNATLGALRLEVFGSLPRADVDAAIRVFKAIEAAASSFAAPSA